MKNLYKFSTQLFMFLVISSSAEVQASEARILARLEQEKVSIPSTHCTNIRVVNGPNGEERQVCNGQKSCCESLQNHLDVRVYFCSRCGEFCHLCKKVCKKNECVQFDKPLEKCWNHFPRMVNFCEECEKKCPLCSKEPQEELEDALVILKDEVMRKELVACTICFDEKEEDDPDWVRFSSCVHQDKDTGKQSYNFCNSCVIDHCENHGGLCPVCRVPIEYPKCNMCRNYLGEDQPTVSWGCLGMKDLAHKDSVFFYPHITETHRCHPECIRPFIENTYKNYYDKVVFWCPLPHQDHVTFLWGVEVEIANLSFVGTDKIETLHVAEKAAILQENACHLCHQVISEDDEKGKCIDTNCEYFRYGIGKFYTQYDYRHKYHTSCLQFFVDKAAFRRNGGIGILCPVNHGYRYDSTMVNKTRFREIVNNFFAISTPERFKAATCSICKDRIQDVLGEGAALIDCARKVGSFLKPEYEKYSFIVCALCISRWLKQKGKEETRGILFSKKVCSYPCPHHEQTSHQHNLFMPIELADTLRGLDEE